MKKIILSSLAILSVLAACNKETTVEQKDTENTVSTDVKASNIPEQDKNSSDNNMEVKDVSTPAPVKLSPEDLKKYKPNELGLIMVLEYHSIARPEARWTRTPENFRKDLDLLYKRGYYLTPLRDFVNNTMDVPAGKSPVILTFDDAREDQFKYIKDKSGNKIIDPDCGIGVIESFTKQHPDFGKAATFFVLPEVSFGQTKEDAQKKYEFLEANGYEIGNHSLSHPMFSTLSDDKVTKELGANVVGVKKFLPNYDVITLAYPYGSVPKNLKVVESGTFQGVKYKNIAAFLVGSEPSYSPVSKKFKPLMIPRIQAIQSEFDRHYAFFKSAPYYKYISDGNKETLTYPKDLPKALIDSVQDKYKKSVVTY